MKFAGRKTGKFFLCDRYFAGLLVLGLPSAFAQAKKIPRGGTLKIVYHEPTHLNMAIVSGTPTGVPGLQIFAGLVQFDENFKPRPYLAKKWEVSADGKNIPFTWKKGPHFTMESRLPPKMWPFPWKP